MIERKQMTPYEILKVSGDAGMTSFEQFLGQKGRVWPTVGSNFFSEHSGQGSGEG